jgi:hypothetical protein
MKNKLFAAALALATLAGAALPAAAQDFRGPPLQSDYRGGSQDFRGDWRFRNQITIRDHGRQFSVDRNDRLFYRLMDSPFRFRPGLTYTYTDRCSRGQCLVLVSSARSGPFDRLWAPRLGDRRFDGRFRGDGRDWNDRGGDGRGYGGGAYGDDHRDNRDLDGGPR